MTEWFVQPDAIPGVAPSNPRNPGYTVKRDPDSAFAAPAPRVGIRKIRKGRRRIETAAVTVYRRGEEIDVRAIGNDAAAVIAFVARFAEAAGYAVEEFVQPQPKGRLTSEERARRDARARCAHELRERGATLEAIAAALRVHKATALRLARSKRNF